MFLTKVEFHHPDWRSLYLDDRAQTHQAVMRLFGRLDSQQGTPRQSAEILYRIEPGNGRVLVQSTAQPADPAVHVTPLTPFLDRLHTGLAVRFLLHANAVRTVNRTDADGHVRRRRAQLDPDQLPDWLHQRVEGALGDLALAPPVTGYARTGRAKLAIVEFQGTATIDSVEVLTRLVRQGIGRAKSYGCGLLTVIPA